MAMVERKMTAIMETQVDLVVNGEPYAVFVQPQLTLIAALWCAEVPSVKKRT